MKTYVKPIIESEELIPNEYISACQPNTSLACINMNLSQGNQGVYKDNLAHEDSLGEYNPTYDTEVVKYSHKNDCGTDGDSSARNHTVSETQSAPLVFIKYNNGSIVPAYQVTTTQANSPHYISVASAVNASA